MTYFHSSNRVFKGYRGIVLWLFILIYFVLAMMLSIAVELRTLNNEFNDQTDEIQRTLTQRISRLDTVLTALVGLYHASDSLSIAERTAFSQEMLKAYPFITSIMHMTRTSYAEKEEFEARMHEQGFVGFKLQDDGQYNEKTLQSNDYHLPVSFIEPMDPRSANMLGYDLVRQPGMLQVINKSIRSGETIAVGPVKPRSAEKSLYFILKPVYLGRYPPIKVQERSEMFDGMAALVIESGQFADGLIGLNNHFRLALTAVDASNATAVMKGPDISALSYSREIDIYGAKLLLAVERQLQPGNVNWMSIFAIWVLSMLILALALSVYINKRIAKLREYEVNAAIAAEDARFSHVVDTAFDAVITADAYNTILSWNQQAVEVFGYSEQEVLGLHLFQLILTEQSLQDITAVIGHIYKGAEERPTGMRLEVEGRHKDDREFPLDLAISCSRIGNEFTLSVFARDITERKRWDEKIHMLAYNDPLTMLPNRQSFKEQVARAIKFAKRHQRIGAVLYLDLDEFKRINDTLGHDIGDLLLKHVTQSLESQLRETDFVGQGSKDKGEEEYWNVARLGGDEFTVLLEDIENPSAAGIVAKRVQNAIVRSYNLNGHEVYITSSIGIAIFPQDGRDVEELLKNADTAMYHAKAVGKNNFQFYSEQMNLLTANRLKLEGKLRKALTSNEMALYYQPQIDLNSGKVVSVEALLRWHDPEVGTILPAEFIPIAEETGMIIEIGEWVLNEACRQNKAWQDAGFNPIRVAVNLSSMQFIQRDLNTKVAQALQNSGLRPEYLELEITESVIMRNVTETIAALNKFKEMGIRVSVDDFGTGYSSLNYLKRLPLDTLKIDRSFIKDIPESEDDVTITSAIIVMAQSLGLDVVAEGVETESQLHLLRQMGCNKSQGYLHSVPLPAEKLADMLLLQTDQSINSSAVPGVI